MTCRNDKFRHWFWTPRKKRWDPVSWAKQEKLRWDGENFCRGGWMQFEGTGCGVLDVSMWFVPSFLIQLIGTETNNLTKWWRHLFKSSLYHIFETKLKKLHRNGHVYWKTYKHNTYRAMYVIITPENAIRVSVGEDVEASQLHCNWIERYYCLVCSSVVSHQWLLTRLCMKRIKAG